MSPSTSHHHRPEHIEIERITGRQLDRVVAVSSPSCTKHAALDCSALHENANMAYNTRDKQYPLLIGLDNDIAPKNNRMYMPSNACIGRCSYTTGRFKPTMCGYRELITEGTVFQGQRVFIHERVTRCFHAMCSRFWTLGGARCCNVIDTRTGFSTRNSSRKFAGLSNGNNCTALAGNTLRYPFVNIYRNVI